MKIYLVVLNGWNDDYPCDECGAVDRGEIVIFASPDINFCKSYKEYWNLKLEEKDCEGGYYYHHSLGIEEVIINVNDFKSPFEFLEELEENND